MKYFVWTRTMIDYEQAEIELRSYKAELKELDESIDLLKKVGQHDVTPLEKKRRDVELKIEVREMYLKDRDDVVHVLRSCRDLIIAVKGNSPLPNLDVLSTRITNSIDKLKNYR